MAKKPFYSKTLAVPEKQIAGRTLSQALSWVVRSRHQPCPGTKALRKHLAHTSKSAMAMGTRHMPSRAI